MREDCRMLAPVTAEVVDQMFSLRCLIMFRTLRWQIGPGGTNCTTQWKSTKRQTGVWGSFISVWISWIRLTQNLMFALCTSLSSLVKSHVCTNGQNRTCKNSSHAGSSPEVHKEMTSNGRLAKYKKSAVDFYTYACFSCLQIGALTQLCRGTGRKHFV